MRAGIVSPPPGRGWLFSALHAASKPPWKHFLPCIRRKWRDNTDAMKNPTDNLEAYLVGGAVRDRLLGLEIRDRDWVVVGATPACMLERGFKPAGEDFPVFLHPHNGEQYALARRERKTARGYKGFAVISDPGITLEQDLQRRDLTINAIAMDSNRNLIDPFAAAAETSSGESCGTSPRHFAKTRCGFCGSRASKPASTRWGSACIPPPAS